MAKSKASNGVIDNLGFEAKLWAAADTLRNNMDAAEYKQVVLGLIFLKYISDAFEAKHAELEAQKVDGANPEDPDEYRAVSIFWVPKEARWIRLSASELQSSIGTQVDDAIVAIGCNGKHRSRCHSSPTSSIPTRRETTQGSSTCQMN